MQSTKLKVNWSTSVIVITLVGSVIVFAVGYVLIKLLYNDFSFLNVSSALLIFGTLFACALQSPRYIVLTDDKLIVKKLFGTFSVERSKIRRVESYAPDSSEVRLFGSGGFFGYLGKFSSAKIGSYRSFVCNFKQAFLIQTFDGKKYVFSCENRDEVINTIKSVIK